MSNRSVCQIEKTDIICPTERVSATGDSGKTCWEYVLDWLDSQIKTFPFSACCYWCYNKILDFAGAIPASNQLCLIHYMLIMCIIMFFMCICINFTISEIPARQQLDGKFWLDIIILHR